MTYTLIWSARNRTQVLAKSIETADKTFPKDVKFLIIDAASEAKHLNSLGCYRTTLSRDIRFVESPKRITLSQAWNLGMMLADTDFFIFASSDVEFLSDKLFPRLVREYYRTKSPYILVDNHSVFMLHKSVLHAIGWFDESFVLGPHFDTDYMLRAQEVQLPIANVPNLNTYTHSDSDEDTILRCTTDVPDRLPMNDFTNDTVFKNKWETSWPGWEPFATQVHKPHPPNQISQVTRKIQELNWHPGYK